MIGPTLRIGQIAVPVRVRVVVDPGASRSAPARMVPFVPASTKILMNIRGHVANSTPGVMTDDRPRSFIPDPVPGGTSSRTGPACRQDTPRLRSWSRVDDDDGELLLVLADSRLVEGGQL
jgi:hypothetical protein